jgi:hypothetical protein
MASLVYKAPPNRRGWVTQNARKNGLACKRPETRDIPLATHMLKASEIDRRDFPNRVIISVTLVEN